MSSKENNCKKGYTVEQVKNGECPHFDEKLNGCLMCPHFEISIHGGILENLDPELQEVLRKREVPIHV